MPGMSAAGEEAQRFGGLTGGLWRVWNLGWQRGLGHPAGWSPTGGGPVTGACLPRRAECATSTPPDLASLAPVEVTSAPVGAVLPEAAVAATTVPGNAGPAPATPAVSPVLAVAVTPAAPAGPAVSTAATLGTVTKDR